MGWKFDERHEIENRGCWKYSKVGKVRRVYIFWKSCLTNEFWLIWLSLNASRVFSRIRKTLASSEIKRYINKVEILVPKDAKRKSEQRCQIRASRSLRWFLRDREKKINLFSSSKEISNNLYFRSPKIIILHITSNPYLSNTLCTLPLCFIFTKCSRSPNVIPFESLISRYLE